MQARFAQLMVLSMMLRADPQQRGCWRQHTRVMELVLEMQAVREAGGVHQVGRAERRFSPVAGHACPVPSPLHAAHPHALSTLPSWLAATVLWCALPWSYLQALRLGQAALQVLAVFKEPEVGPGINHMARMCFVCPATQHALAHHL